MNTGETIALIKALGKGGGGSGLPSVTSSDNGKVLTVDDGAWAADANTIFLPVTDGKVELTGAEITALVEGGKTVILAVSNEYDVYVGSNYGVAYFAHLRSNNILYRSVGSNKRVVAMYTVPLPSVSASDNGSELIVKDGAWKKQQKKFIVTLTPTSPDFSGTMDKTVAEIYAAYEAGQEIVFKLQTSVSTYIEVPIQLVGHDTTLTYPSFETSVVKAANNLQVFASTAATDDGTKQTYSTRIYSLTPAS